MNEHDTWDPDHANPDHWEIYAEALDLTIEGHRLIAQEIAFEAKLLWRGAMSRLRGMAGVVPRRRSIPPL